MRERRAEADTHRMRTAWARGAEWWRQHGHQWWLVPASWLVFGLGYAVALHLYDPWPRAERLFFSSPIIGLIWWCWLFGFGFAFDLLRGRRDLLRARRSTSGALLYMGMLFPPLTVIGHWFLES